MSVKGAELELKSLPRVSARRRMADRTVQSLVYAAFVIAIIPLVSVLWMVVTRGMERLDLDFLTFSMNGLSSSDEGGGANHAIVGTLQQVGLTAVMAVPLGILTGVYLVEYGGNSRLARVITFFVDVMTGIPSIVAGLFILAFWLLALGFEYSGFAGALALAILMMPTVVRATEEMLKLVPNDLREASYALGVPRWRTICFVVLPTALTGIVTGVMLAVARVMGETAPLLLLVFITDAINSNPFEGPQGSLPTFIWYQAGDPNPQAIERAWAAALTLILIIMLLNLGARLLARLRKPVSR
ncbi:phosphate ABC transporter membrane protein 2, PhoT family [Thermomonospora echinospora]|uniref:Phosphate transport system permease protein PstA n=1 Tax=Thermomonospora echinospora TaxID=1992 RepID=A0A1H6D2J0_9ACTN|nr:phosphate ABC transporter permease PstA [Thermomonospora echinospora]SEG79218.1 phosphate ABC transporter membrane protein 2, PhoT family [Thermomonospora echinospora]